MSQSDPSQNTIGRRILYDIGRFNVNPAAVQRIFDLHPNQSVTWYVGGPRLTVAHLQTFAEETGVDARSYLTPGTMIAGQTCRNCEAADAAAPPEAQTPPIAAVKARRRSPHWPLHGGI